MDRRTFLLAGVGGVPAATVYAGFGRTAGTTFVRKNLDDLTPNEWADFETCVQAVKDKKGDLGWDAFAGIHPRVCPHGNNFFLPWHRAYLYYFELICREVAKKPNFTLPYWDWTKTPKVPKQFLDKGSSLYHSKRIGANLAVPAKDDRVGQKEIARVMAYNSFAAFGGAPAADLQDASGGGGQLESAPHDYIHAYVGRDPRGIANGTMFTTLSPLDPLFWVHHSNVDRLWAEWCYKRPPKGGASKRWPSAASWHNQVVEFISVGADEGTKRVKDCLSMYDLSYTYDQFFKATDPNERPRSEVTTGLAERELGRAEDERGVRISEKIRIGETRLTLNGKVADALASHLKYPARSEARLWIRFSTVAGVPGDVDLFINPTKDGILDRTDPSYLGYVAAGIVHAAHHAAGRVAILDPTVALSQMKLEQARPLTVRFVLNSEATEVQVKEVRLDIVGIDL